MKHLNHILFDAPTDAGAEAAEAPAEPGGSPSLFEPQEMTAAEAWSKGLDLPKPQDKQQAQDPPQERQDPKGQKPEQSAPAAEKAESSPEQKQDKAEAEPEAEQSEEVEAEAAEQVEAEAAPDPNALPEGVLSEIRRAVPDRVIEGVGDLTAYLGDLQESRSSLETLLDKISQDETVQTFFTKVLGEEALDPQTAALEVFGKLTQAPDPDEDPEAYANWKAAQARQEERSKVQKQQTEAEQRRAQRQQKDAQRLFNSFTERQAKADESFDQDAFLRRYLTYTQGDETGRMPADAFDVFHKGLNHDRLVREAVEKAKQEAAAEAVQTVAKKQKEAGSGAPVMEEAGGTPPEQELSPQMQQWNAMFNRKKSPAEVFASGAPLN